MLRDFLWMARLSRGAEWAIILGLVLGDQVLLQLAINEPALAPWIKPIRIAYISFCVMTWIAYPLFNLLLRLNRFGRHALSREQVIASNLLAVLLFPALAALVVWLITGNDLAFVGMVFFGLLMLPLCAIFYCSQGWPRRTMIGYTVLLALAGLAWLPLVVLFGKGWLVLLTVFLWGSILSGFVANGLSMVNPRR